MGRLSQVSETQGRLSEEFLREWCWGHNQRCIEAGYPHWLYVSKDKETGAMTTKARSGADATDVINVGRGIRPDYHGWSADRLASEYRILSMMLRMGMPAALAENPRLPASPRALAHHG